MNEKSVYRTAPATTSLLEIPGFNIFCEGLLNKLGKGPKLHFFFKLWGGEGAKPKYFFGVWSKHFFCVGINFFVGSSKKEGDLLNLQILWDSFRTKSNFNTLESLKQSSWNEQKMPMEYLKGWIMLPGAMKHLYIGYFCYILYVRHLKVNF